MTITRSSLKTAVAFQYPRVNTDKEASFNEAVQFIADDIAMYFEEFRGLKDGTTEIAMTQYQSYIDIGDALSNLYGNRIKRVVVIDSADHDNDRALNNELDFETQYLDWLPDPDNPQTEHFNDIIEAYARYGDYIYFKPVPDITTLSAKIYYGKIHPTIGNDQDILYPADFKQCMVHGVLWYIYSFVERKDQLKGEHAAIYESMRGEKIRMYTNKPNKVRVTAYSELG